MSGVKVFNPNGTAGRAAVGHKDSTGVWMIVGPMAAVMAMAEEKRIAPIKLQVAADIWDALEQLCVPVPGRYTGALGECPIERHPWLGPGDAALTGREVMSEHDAQRFLFAQRRLLKGAER